MSDKKCGNAEIDHKQPAHDASCYDPGFFTKAFFIFTVLFCSPAPSSSPFSFVLPVFHFFRLQIHISRTFFWIFCFFPNHVFLRVRFRRIIIFFGLFFKNVSFSRFLRILFRPVRLRFCTAFSRAVRVFIPGIFKSFLTEDFYIFLMYI